MTDQAPSITVIVPTVGRTELLQACLESINRLETAPLELIVAVQGAAGPVVDIVRSTASLPAAVVASDSTGAATNRNNGALVAAGDVLAFTDDDCQVDADWLTFVARIAEPPERELLTGAVAGLGDEDRIPTTFDAPARTSHTDADEAFWMAKGGNFAVRRRQFLDLGGFDERFEGAAEDLELAHRWIRSGGTMTVEPQMRVAHTAWREPSELTRTYHGYAEGLGQLYGSAFAGRDRRAFRTGCTELRAAIASQRRGGADDPRQNLMERSMVRRWPLGFARGVARRLGRGGAWTAASLHATDRDARVVHETRSEGRR